MLTSASSQEKPQGEVKRLGKRLLHQVGKAIVDYGMIEDGDRVLVCLSGGKDSYTMLDVLMRLQRKAPVSFSLFAVHLDQKQPGYPAHILPDYLEKVGVPYEILQEDTYSIVQRIIPEGKTTCSLCSRLRRGILYSFAEQKGMTKIALGHHRDDIVETMFLNMFFNGSLKAMPAKLKSDSGRHILIRPLAYARESEIETYADLREFPIIPCNLCGSQDHLQRKVVKQMLRQWEQVNPERIDTIFKAIQNVKPSQLLDRNLFDFESLRAEPGTETEETPASLFSGMPV